MEQHRRRIPGWRKPGGAGQGMEAVRERDGGEPWREGEDGGEPWREERDGGEPWQ